MQFQLATRESDMSSTTSVNGFPAIQSDGRGVLSVWGQDWKFAKWLCELLNELNDRPKLLLDEQDCKWRKQMDHTFGRTVQHA